MREKLKVHDGDTPGKVIEVKLEYPKPKAATMSDMKCPFCQQEYVIHKDDSCFGQQRCVCRNPNCEFDGWHFPIKLVSELIHTRKALDVAVDALKDNLSQANFREMLDASRFHCIRTKCESALEQITALEQKDK